jgi:hypothetical protein
MAQTIITASGQYFNLETPEPSDINIDDIAHALSNICRYTGHTRVFYSVAQHATLVSRVVPEECALYGLLHDAAEAYIGDVSRPLKALLPDYRLLEVGVEAAVFRRFRLTQPMPAVVKHADLVLLRTEQRDLLGADRHVWQSTEGLEPLPIVIDPMPPAVARNAFLARFYELLPAEIKI